MFWTYACLFLNTLMGLSSWGGASDPLANDELGKTAAEIIQLRGFKAQDYYLTTSDGYILNLIRATNPLMDQAVYNSSNKDVLLFIHGIITNAKCFIAESVDARPEDYSQLNAGQMSDEDLIARFNENPSFRSLVFAALNFGHEVWLLNRRGTQYSQGHVEFSKQPRFNYTTSNSNSKKSNSRKKRQAVDFLINNPLTGAIKEFSDLLASAPASLLTQFDPVYWNYTLDTEAAIDFPESVDFVLKVTKKPKLSIVGQSAGAALPLMALSQKPELADKLNKAVLWAPAVDQGATPPEKRSFFRNLSLYFQLILETYSGPILPTLINPLIKAIAASLCEPQLAASTLCSAADSFIFGYSGSQQKIKPGHLTAGPDAVGSHELAQLIQGVTNKRSHFYEYSSARENLIAYGSERPPEYDFSRIKFDGMSIWYGQTDAFVQYRDVQQLISDLTVPAKTRFFNDHGLYWNHVSFFIHDNITNYLILPSLKTLESQ